MGIVAISYLLASFAAAPTVILTVNTKQGAHSISPYIYGSNSIDFTGRWKVSTFSRIGGNRPTAYNWETNASNAGSDWYNENDNFLGGGSTPLNAFMPTINAALSHGAPMLMTLQMAGHVSADEAPPGDVNQTANYLNVRFNKSYSTSPKGTNLTAAPNLNDHAVYEDQLVAHVNSERVKNSTPVWWNLDNEPDLWASTHSRIVTSPETYQDLVSRSVEYATMVKKVSSSSLVFGPVSYGWNGYQSLQNAPDANGRYFLEYYLAQMQQASHTAGKRLLDVLDLHYYSEATGGGVRVTNAGTDPALVAARVQSPRSLYDSTYTEDSWITTYSTHGPIDLIPRMFTSISHNYAGTLLSLSEYNFGGEDVSGGIAEADALGAFGNQNLFAAAIWPIQSNVTWLQSAFELYRNYDGKGSAFGNTSVYGTSSNLAAVSVWASTDTVRKNHVYMVVINKTTVNQPIMLKVTGPTLKQGVQYRLTGAAAKVVSAGTVKISGGSLSTILVPMSATIIDFS